MSSNGRMGSSELPDGGSNPSASTNDGLAIESATHTLSGFTPTWLGKPELSPECFEIWYSHTVTRKGLDVTFYYRDESTFTERLKDALRYGGHKLNLNLQ